MNLKEHLNSPIFNIVSTIAQSEDLETYVIGGFVRDTLIKRQCNQDIDFVCIGHGINLAKKVNNQLEGESTLTYFKNFGTAMIKYNDKCYEFVGARRESYRSNSRKPIVEDGTLKDDQKRRDFTINAMAISLNKNNYGDLLDPFNGVQDLKNKIIRTPLDPDITYSDDPLRMIRAIRFASTLNFNIHNDSLESIKKHATRLSIVSQERITEELNKILLSEKPSYGLQLLFKTKTMHQFFLELTELEGVEEKDGFAHKDNFFHTLEVVDNIKSKTTNLWLIWAALLHDIAKPTTKRFNKKNGWTFHGHEVIGSRMASRIFKRLKLPLNEKMRYVQKLIRLHLRPIILSKEIVTDSAVRRLIFDAGEDIDDLMTLCEADITSKNINKVEKYIKNFQIVRGKIKEVEEKDEIRNWKPPIDGHEIMKLLQLKEGKKVGLIKESIKNAILDGEIENNKEAAIKFINKTIQL